jgi:Protein of unknown function (DUF3465)
MTLLSAAARMKFMRDRFTRWWMALAVGIMTVLPGLPVIAGEKAVSQAIAAPAVRILSGDGGLATAYNNRLSGAHVTCRGVVTRKLSDDLSGIRHQKFIVALASGQTLLIVHNIDLAKRVATLKTGDAIRISGDYIWNIQGGLVHETHDSPSGTSLDGWIKHRGVTYR